jgi:hypothetical protein
LRPCSGPWRPETARTLCCCTCISARQARRWASSSSQQGESPAAQTEPASEQGCDPRAHSRRMDLEDSVRVAGEASAAAAIRIQGHQKVTGAPPSPSPRAVALPRVCGLGAYGLIKWCTGFGIQPERCGFKDGARSGAYRGGAVAGCDRTPGQGGYRRAQEPAGAAAPSAMLFELGRGGKGTTPCPA